MKIRQLSLLGMMAIALFGCKKSDDTPAPPIDPPAPVNMAPGAFDLVEVVDGAEAVDFLPTLTWQAATDPEGDTVSYDLFLDTADNPTTLLSEGLSATSFTVADSLERATDYNWKVVAKDTEGNTTSSVVFGFTTIGLVTPSDPVTSAAEFTARQGHASAAFDGKLWVIGGNDIDNIQHDVWSSADGATWTLETADPGFETRSSHASVVFQNQLWVIGGVSFRQIDNGPGVPPTDELYYLEDVWSSTNGTDWVEQADTVGFGPRDGITAGVLGDKIFVIGGFDGTDYKNDVWSTTDGVTWVEETASAEFSPRSGHTTAIFDNKIWVAGGWNGVDTYNDVWYSSDGVTWTEATDDGPFSLPVNMTMTAFDGKLWVIGGFTTTAVNDIWYSSDGVEWRESLPKAGFSARGEHTTVLFNDKLWVIGGYDGTSLVNDVWVID